jgi:hypothetical protein
MGWTRMGCGVNESRVVPGAQLEPHNLPFTAEITSLAVARPVAAAKDLGVSGLVYKRVWQLMKIWSHQECRWSHSSLRLLPRMTNKPR